MFHCLNEILDLCHSFCSLVSQNLGPLDERGAAQLSILVKVSLPGCWKYTALSKGWRNMIFPSEAIKHFPQYIHTKITRNESKMLVLVDFKADNYVLPQHSKIVQP